MNKFLIYSFLALATVCFSVQSASSKKRKAISTVTLGSKDPTVVKREKALRRLVINRTFLIGRKKGKAGMVTYLAADGTQYFWLAGWRGLGKAKWRSASNAGLKVNGKTVARIYICLGKSEVLAPCASSVAFKKAVVDSRSGDIFNLKSRRKAPYKMGRWNSSLKALLKKCKDC